MHCLTILYLLLIATIATWSGSPRHKVFGQKTVGPKNNFGPKMWLKNIFFQSGKFLMSIATVCSNILSDEYCYCM